jgi:hypothetical protein
VQLDNQFVDNGNNFFQIYNGKKVGIFIDTLVFLHYFRIPPVPPDSAVYFDLYYVNARDNLFVISSGSDDYFSEFYPSYNKFKLIGDEVTFYEVPRTFTYANYDTIKTGLDIPRLIRVECIKHNPLNRGVYNAIVSKDSFGWAKNTIIGFKTLEDIQKQVLLKFWSRQRVLYELKRLVL